MTKHTRNSRRLTKGETIDLDRLSELLDVSVEGWDRAVRRLVREMRTKQVRIMVPRSEILATVGSSAAGVSWPRLFAAQVRQLPRMDRAGEFRIARGYEFLKARVRDALLFAGYAESVVDELVLASDDALPEPAKRRAPSRLEFLRERRDELERLRNLYVERSLYLVGAPVRRYRNLGVDEADLIQEANASLFQAVDGFDWRREVRFKTYAIFWIQQAILKALYNSSRTVRVPVWVQKTYRKIQRLREAGLHESGMVPSSTAIGDQLGLPASRVDEILGVRRYAVSLDAKVRGDETLEFGNTLPDEHTAPVPDQVEEGDLKVGLDAAMADIPVRERTILERRFGLAEREPETLAQIAADLGITAERVRQLQNAAINRLKKPSRIRHLRAFS